MQIELDAEMIGLLDAEKADMRTLILHVADLREHDPQAAHDRRYREAARNLRDIAESVANVDDELLLQVAMIARLVEDRGGADLISELIATKLTATCFELPAFPSASALLQSIVDAAEAARAKAAGSIN